MRFAAISFLLASVLAATAAPAATLEQLYGGNAFTVASDGRVIFVGGRYPALYGTPQTFHVRRADVGGTFVASDDVADGTSSGSGPFVAIDEGVSLGSRPDGSVIHPVYSATTLNYQTEGCWIVRKSLQDGVPGSWTTVQNSCAPTYSQTPQVYGLVAHANVVHLALTIGSPSRGVVRRSTDGGASWMDVDTVSATSGAYAGNISRDPGNGAMYWQSTYLDSAGRWVTLLRASSANGTTGSWQTVDTVTGYLVLGVAARDGLVAQTYYTQWQDASGTWNTQTYLRTGTADKKGRWTFTWIPVPFEAPRTTSSAVLVGSNGEIYLANSVAREQWQVLRGTSGKRGYAWMELDRRGAGTLWTTPADMSFAGPSLIVVGATRTGAENEWLTVAVPR